MPGDESIPPDWIGDRTLAEIACDELQLELQVSLGGRFTESGWKFYGEVDERCPECGFQVWMCRKPYVSVGKPYRYYAFICKNCEVVLTKGDVGYKTRAEDRLRRRGGRSLAVPPATTLDASLDGASRTAGDKQGSSTEIIAAAIERLTYRQRRVLDLRREGRTLDEIGRIFNVTRERIRQIQNQAVRRVAQMTNRDVRECSAALGLVSAKGVPASGPQVFPGSSRRGNELTPSQVEAFDAAVKRALRDGLIAGRHLTALVLTGSESERVHRLGYTELRVHGAFPDLLRSEIVDRLDQLIEAGDLILTDGSLPVLALPDSSENDP